jgi:hypothetical protein
VVDYQGVIITMNEIFDIWHYFQWNIITLAGVSAIVIITGLFCVFADKLHRKSTKFGVSTTCIWLKLVKGDKKNGCNS